MSSGIKEELRKFAESTSIKGVGRSVKASRRTVRIFWMTALVACSTLLLYQVTTVFIKYFSYDVIRNSGVVQKQPRFPDITVCNTFPPADASTLDSYNNYMTALVGVTNSNKYASILLSQATTPNLGIVNTFSFYDEKTALQMLVDNTFVWRSEAMLYPNCSIGPRIVPPLQWCLTISCDLPAKSLGVPSLIAVLTDNTFRKETTNWFNMLASTATGLNVMVHSKGYSPDPSSVVGISPGTATTVFVTKTNITRLPAPWGNCTYREYMYPENISSLQIYDQALCQSLCAQQMAIQKCSCLDHSLYFTDADLQVAPFCLNMTPTFDRYINDSVVDESLLNDSMTKINCWNDFAPDVSTCDCPVQCIDVEAAVTVTTASWPDPMYQLDFYKKYIRNESRFMGAFDEYESILNDSLDVRRTIRRLQAVKLIPENFLKLVVQFETNYVQMITDIPAMTWDTMASNLGGSLNLWLGLSVLTLAELIELMYDVLMICRLQRHHPSKQPEVAVPDPDPDPTKNVTNKKVFVVGGSSVVLEMEDPEQNCRIVNFCSTKL